MLTRGERPVWKLNDDEKRTLMITFVGGGASIVVAAGIVGGAIALGRTLQQKGVSESLPLKIALGVFVISTPLSVVSLYLGNRRIFLRVAAVATGVSVLGTCVFLLAGIGMLAGLH
jgi:hypothetical protein